MAIQATVMRRAVGAVLVTLLAASAGAAPVEVLHWWTSGGEARSVAELKRLLAREGHEWRDVAVVGGGGDSAMDLLRQRIQAGQPPAAAQIKGPAIQAWGRSGALASLDEVAREQRWDTQLPRVVADAMQYQGRFVAVPVNVHRVNWLWVSRAALRKAGVRAPQTWDEFFAAAERLRLAGVVPVAHGGQPWQVFTTFESVVLGVGGAEFYRRAFVQLDPQALQGDTMVRALATLRRIKGYTDAQAPGRDWSQATAMVIRGEAAMQFMGDWAKGEFLAAGQVPGRDFLCVAAPQTDRAFIFNIDSFAMFRQGGERATPGQEALARTIMTPEFQQLFNLAKGSVPVGTGVRMDSFDLCGQESRAYFVASSMLGSLVPSIAHKMAQPDAIEAALRQVVSDFWDNDAVSEVQAGKALAQAARLR